MTYRPVSIVSVHNREVVPHCNLYVYQCSSVLLGVSDDIFYSRLLNGPMISDTDCVLVFGRKIQAPVTVWPRLLTYVLNGDS